MSFQLDFAAACKRCRSDIRWRVSDDCKKCDMYGLAYRTDIHTDDDDVDNEEGDKK